MSMEVSVSSKLSLLTSTDAVMAAIAECNQLGRDKFLERYGYKYSRLYPLHYDGHTTTPKPSLARHSGSSMARHLKPRNYPEALRR
ncbi:hypothetical protein [Nitrosomonas sp.]|uniref:hypothetical protein n=1 Tax=Nitrosomonas sp. TaxID=42353 RepID=UPI0025FE70C8|nr:hypothetical protein [Nitrosomonas sp.]MBY0485063.1 hypothetical protein [Nitrosomonas sp.]